MTEGRPRPPSPRRLDDLGRRIAEARGRGADNRAGGRAGKGRQDVSGLGLGLRLSVEMVSALAVGLGIGYVLDRVFGTAPLLLIVFMVMGALAGFLNVYRAAREIQATGRPGEADTAGAEASDSARETPNGPPRATDADDDE